MHRKPLIKILFVLLIAMVAAPQARAQAIMLEGPLVGQPAVKKMRLLREGRLSIMPNFGVTLLDRYRQNVLIGLKMEYSFFEWLAIGIYGVGAINTASCVHDCSHMDTKLTDEVKSKARSSVLNLPDAARFDEQVGSIQGILTARIILVPLRGKLGLFKSLFLNADFYVFLGGGIAWIKDRSWAYAGGDPQAAANVDYNCRDESPTDGMADDYNSCVRMESRIAMALPTVGAGFDLFINDWLAFNIEYQGIPLKMNQSGTDEYGHDANQNNADPGYYNKSAKFPDGYIDDKDRVFTWVSVINFGLTFYFTFGKSEGIFKPRVTD